MKLSGLVCLLVLSFGANGDEFVLADMEIYPNSVEVRVLIEDTEEKHLDRFMDAYTSQDQLELSSQSEDLVLYCIRPQGPSPVTCNIRFRKSDRLYITPERMDYRAIYWDADPFVGRGALSLLFKNKEGQTFHLLPGDLALLAGATY